MSRHPVGSMIAIQKDGTVYMGFVSSREGDTCTVDVIADDVYRGANREQITGCVDVSLRDRISTVITQIAEGRAIYQLTNADASVMADAVIEALGLEQEDGECGYCQAQLPGCRYVTDWSNDA